MSFFSHDSVLGFFSFNRETDMFTADASDLDWPIEWCPEQTITLEGQRGNLEFTLVEDDDDAAVYAPMAWYRKDNVDFKRIVPSDLEDIRIVVFND